LRPKTNEHHRGFKVEDARGWLEHGMKVLVTIRFRGREVTYPEIALERLEGNCKRSADIAVVEKAPAMEGRSMNMLLAPQNKRNNLITSPVWICSLQSYWQNLCFPV
jgi:translation initiation factor IF-3